MDAETERRRHSAAHVLAMAAQRLFPDVKLGIGPVTKEGFYHDFQFPTPITWEDIKKLESEINLLVQEDLPFNKLMVPKEQAFEILMTRGQIFKSELLQEVSDSDISMYKTGEEFIDLCRGPHVASTNKVGAVKLLSISEVTWKNETNRPALQRITGVVFPTARELNHFVTRQQAIQTRDFRKYGQDLELFSPEGDNGILYTPQGTIALNSIKDRIMHLLAETGYHEVITPTRNEVGRGEELLDKIYGLKNRSYRSLPYQILTVQNSTLEQPVHISGKQLHNISELDAKAYLVDDNGRSVLKQIMTNLIRINAALQLKVYAQVHASDLDLEILGIVSETLRAKDVSQTQIIDATTPDHTIRINFIAKDSLDREWDIIQVELTTQGPVFVEETGEHVASLTIHTHTVLENLLAFYLEDQEGGLPYWASPVQVAIVPISEAQEIYSEHIKETLANKGLRILVDNRSETMQARIRDAEVAKIPIIVIIGEKEETSRAVSVRLRNKQELGLVSEDSLEETLQSYVTSFSIS